MKASYFYDYPVEALKTAQTSDLATRLLLQKRALSRSELSPSSIAFHTRSALSIAARIIALGAVLTLTACAGGDHALGGVVSPVADTAIAAAPLPLAEPAPAHKPATASEPTPEAEPITYCPFSSTTPCPPSPSPAPVRVITGTPSLDPVCVRNSEPLIDVAGVLVDNCGNKYGAVSN